MKSFKELMKYDFHDSLLEDVFYDSDNKKVLLKIDFCNWKQEWYNECEEETSIISIVFNNVSNVVMPELKFNSDEIIEFEILSDSCAKILVFNDISETSYKIIIEAESAEIIEDKG